MRLENHVWTSFHVSAYLLTHTVNTWSLVNTYMASPSTTGGYVKISLSAPYSSGGTTKVNVSVASTYGGSTGKTNITNTSECVIQAYGKRRY